MLKEYETEKEIRQKGKKEIKRWHSSILNSSHPHQIILLSYGSLNPGLK